MNHRPRCSLLAAFCLFFPCGCAENLHWPLPDPAYIPNNPEPLGAVTGGSKATYLFGRWQFGDDSPEAAILNAKGRFPEGDVIQASVEHRSFCFPYCSHPLWRSSITTVNGMLVRDSRFAGSDKPPAPPRKKLLPGESPSTARVAESLERLYFEDPGAAAEFYASLSRGVKFSVRDFILSQKGTRSVRGSAFLIPKDAPPKEKEFLRWFVGRKTVYDPVDE